MAAYRQYTIHKSNTIEDLIHTDTDSVTMSMRSHGSPTDHTHCPTESHQWPHRHSHRYRYKYIGYHTFILRVVWPHIHIDTDSVTMSVRSPALGGPTDNAHCPTNSQQWPHWHSNRYQYKHIGLHTYFYGVNWPHIHTDTDSVTVSMRSPAPGSPTDNIHC